MASIRSSLRYHCKQDARNSTCGAPEAFGDACVSDETAFFALYEELSLDVGCSLGELKHAYRRRASQLHPDRGGMHSDVQRLQRLNALYDSALEFHRTHGRLPGNLPRPRIFVPAEPSPGASPPAVPKQRRWLLAGTCLLALLLYWLGLSMRSGEAPSLDPVGPGDRVAPGLLQPHAPDLALGMDKHLARKLLGQPDEESAMRWDYGPSWVEFQCGKVIGWYSSPLRPLRVDQNNPHAAPAQSRGC